MSINPGIRNLINPSQFPTFGNLSLSDLTQLLNDIKYKDYVFLRDNKDSGFFSRLEIVLENDLGFEVPGSGGMRILLNPSGGSTNIPVKFYFKWGIIEQVNSFSGDAEQMFNSLNTLANSSPEILLTNLIANFTGGDFESFLSFFNSHYNQTLQSIGGQSLMDQITDFISQIQPLGIDITDIIFSYLNSLPDPLTNILHYFNNWFPFLNNDNYLDHLLPEFSISLNNIYAGLEFPLSVLRVVNPADNEPMIVDGNYVPSVLTFNVGSLNYSTATGFSFINESQFSFPKSEILRTGFTLDFTNVKIDLNRNTNIPEAVADGRPPDFIGAYIKEATIGFPKKWKLNPVGQTTAIIRSNNLLIGTGGISGDIGLYALGNDDPEIALQLGDNGFRFGINHFLLSFHQNTIVRSEIKGFLHIPGFRDSAGNDALIVIDIHIADNGDFSITASEDQGIQALHLPGVFSLNLDSLTVGKRDDRYYVAISGLLNLTTQSDSVIGNNLPSGIPIPKMIIWEDGGFEFEGGAIVLPKAFSLKLGPAAISVTAIHIGSHEQDYDGHYRKFKYFGFDGGISVNPGGVDARGDGIKFYYTVDMVESGLQYHSFLRIQSLVIDIVIPDTADLDKQRLVLHGYLAMKEPANDDDSTAQTDYSGGVAFKLNFEKLKIAGSADMRYNPALPSFLVDIGIELPVPIPIGTTGLGIYGFRGLLGSRYVASRSYIGLTEEDPWYMYYKEHTPPIGKEGITASKFSPENGLSLGAGVSFATAAGDSGKFFSSKLFFMLSLPEVFLMEGQGQILKKRIGLDSPEDPPFYAFISVDAVSVQAAIGAHYLEPSNTGDVVTLDGLIEMAFFFGNSQGWYINIGRDMPAEKRIRARLLDMVDAYFYLMLSASGIRVGAGAAFEAEYHFGPVKAELKSAWDVAGYMSNGPKQYGAAIQAGGSLDVSVFGLGLLLSMQFALSAESPMPRIVAGSAEFRVKLLMIDKKFTINFVWEPVTDYQTTPVPVLDAMSVAAVNIHTLDTFSLDQSYVAMGGGIPEKSIPVDSFIDIEFKVPVNPINTVGILGGVSDIPEYSLLLPPKKAKAQQVRHEFFINSISVGGFDGNQPNLQGDSYQLGYWQRDAAGRYTKIRLLAQSPFSYLIDAGTNNAPWSEVSQSLSEVFCQQQLVNRICIPIEELIREVFIAPVELIPFFPSGQFIYAHGASFRLLGPYGTTIRNSGYGTGLPIASGQSLEILFDQPSAFAEITIGAEGNATLIEFQRRLFDEDNDLNGIPQTFYETVQSETVSSQVPTSRTYSDDTKPIDRILITPGNCFVKPTDTSTLPPLLPCSMNQLIRDLGGLLNGIAKAGHLWSPDLTLLTDAEHLESFFRYLLAPAFNACNKKPDTPPATGDLLSSMSLITADVRYWTAMEGSVLVLLLEVKNCITYRLNLETMVNGTLIDIGNIESLSCWSIISTPDTNGCYAISVMAEGSHLKVPLSGTLCMSGQILNNGMSTAICHAWYYQLCYLSSEVFAYNELVSTFNTATGGGNGQAASINIPSDTPIWSANTEIQVIIETEDRIFKGGELINTAVQQHQYSFKTDGPPGYFHKNDAGTMHPEYSRLAGLDQEAQFRYSNLQHYINYAASYPNADGRLTNAKPMFYGSVNLYLYFKRPYVYTFYNSGWGGYTLRAKIKDPAQLHIPDMGTTPSPWSPVDTDANWELVSTSVETQPLEVSGMNCISINTAAKWRLMASFLPGELKPLKCYTAIFQAYKGENDGREVHRYNFETSRYRDFEDQINSFYLIDKNGNEGMALFVLEQEISTAAMADMNAVLSGSESDVLIKSYMNRYDRLLFGALGLQQLPPALTTEVNIIKDSATQQQIGILVRNPEPFNDPKIPAEVMADSITASLGGSNSGSGIFSEDASAVFLPAQGGSFSGNAMDILFILKTYDPLTGQYITGEQMTLSII